MAYKVWSTISCEFIMTSWEVEWRFFFVMWKFQEIVELFFICKSNSHEILELNFLEVAIKIIALKNA